MFSRLTGLTSHELIKMNFRIVKRAEQDVKVFKYADLGREV